MTFTVLLIEPQLTLLYHPTNISLEESASDESRDPP